MLPFSPRQRSFCLPYSSPSVPSFSCRPSPFFFSYALLLSPPKQAFRRPLFSILSFPLDTLERLDRLTARSPWGRVVSFSGVGVLDWPPPFFCTYTWYFPPFSPIPSSEKNCFEFSVFSPLASHLTLFLFLLTSFSHF